MNATQTAPSATAARPARWGRHPVNIGHLVMGIAFLGLVAVWMLIASDVVDGGDVRWLLPVPWVLAGIAGLLATTITGQRRYANSQSGWVDTRDRDEPAYDPNPNRDLDEKIDAAARERQAGRGTETATSTATDTEAEPTEDESATDEDDDVDKDDGTAI